METHQHSRWSLYRPLGKFIALGIMILAFGLGYYTAGIRYSEVPHDHERDAGQRQSTSTEAEPRSDVETKSSAIWTCAMHPQIKMSEPGQCPICGMDLVPVSRENDGAKTDVVRHTMSEAAKRLAEVESTEVKRQRAFVSIRMVGMVFEDETRVASLTSRVDGRLDDIHVDFTGVKVNKGDPMVTIWSPTLIRSQVELFETIRSPEFGDAVVRGAEEKLKQFGLTDQQIDEIRKNKKPTLYVTLRAPIDGIVMKKNVLLGDFVKEGAVMYEITDLSKVWIKLDAYETDLPWIRYGQKVTFTTPAIPGRQFQGTVVFVDPMLQMSTRSVKVRVEADNSDLLLKPHMFVTAHLEAEIDSKGRVIKSEWAGKYICPIDPEEVSPTPGVCPATQIPMRSAESYGYAPEKHPELPLVIPATAVLYTGKRSVVYVEVPDADRPTYELRHVVLGPRAGDEYVVFGGLRAGERVVTKGNFKIDSATQIQARPSMMSPEKTVYADDMLKRLEEKLDQARIEAPQAFGMALNPVFDEYLRLKDAIAKGEADAAEESAKRLNELIHSVNLQPLGKRARDTWNRLTGRMVIGLMNIAGNAEREVQRKAFGDASRALAALIVGFWQIIDRPLLVFFCSTAFDGAGAYWIETTADFKNPYSGPGKPKCGKPVLKIPLEKKTDAAGASDGPAGSRSKHEMDSREKSGHEATSHEGSGTKGKATPQGSSTKRSRLGGEKSLRGEKTIRDRERKEPPVQERGSGTPMDHGSSGSGTKNHTNDSGSETQRHPATEQGSGTKHGQPVNEGGEGSSSKTN